MYWQFINLLIFFFSFRKERQRKFAIGLTSFNKFIICWTVFLWLLCVYQSLTSIQTLVLRIQSQDYFKQDIWVYYLSFLFFIVFPFRDLFIASSFAYLYYYQGTKQAKEGDNEAHSDRNGDTQDLKHLLSRETTVQEPERQSATDLVSTFNYASNKIEGEEAQPHTKKKAQMILPLRSEYDLNVSQTDSVTIKYERRSTIFKNEQFRGFIYQQLRMD